MANVNSNVDYNTKILEIDGLKKHFVHGTGKNKLIIPAVDGLKFDVYKREVFGLVGESGCGKTTTGRTIMKLYNPTEGISKLNNQIIGAGYKQHVRRIKEIKKEATEKILRFDKQMHNIVEINTKCDLEVDNLKGEIAILKQERLSKITLAETPIRAYKTLKYETKNIYQMDIESFEYDFYNKSTKVIELTSNGQQVEYEREVSGAKNNFKRKVEGLNESAALTKETIEGRIEETRIKLEANLERLEKKFIPLISAQEELIISKEDGKNQVNALKEIKKAQVLERKGQYKNDVSKIVAPDKTKIKAEVTKINADFNQKIGKIEKEIATLKAEAKKAVSLVPANSGLGVNQEELKVKTDEILQWRNESIKEQKDLIHSLKVVNKSEEALLMSRKMQMIFQDPISSLNPRMTVQEIVGEGLTILGGYSKDEIKEKVGETLELVGLSKEYAARYPHEFSGGQRQRIGVARALIMNPDFIIADEPISALDVSIRAQVINLLSELKESLGLTMLFIAHDLSVVRFFCDRIAVMYNGKIVELAKSEELFKNPMHPYTISLLSSIPQPDPDYERNRKKIDYNPRLHDYRVDKPVMREIINDHHVYANEKEFAEIMAAYSKNNKINNNKKDEVK